MAMAAGLAPNVVKGRGVLGVLRRPVWAPVKKRLRRLVRRPFFNAFAMRGTHRQGTGGVKNVLVAHTKTISDKPHASRVVSIHTPGHSLQFHQPLAKVAPGTAYRWRPAIISTIASVPPDGPARPVLLALLVVRGRIRSSMGPLLVLYVASVSTRRLLRR
jgi:hypothetical protein